MSVIEYKAVVYENRNKPLKMVTHKLEPITSNEVLIKMKACALNPIESLVYGMTPLWFNYFKLEVGLGMDFSGEIEEVGSLFAEKYGFVKGDKVCGFASAMSSYRTMAEYVKFDVTKPGYDIVKIPEGFDYNKAAAFPVVYCTAVAAKSAAKIEPDSKVLVNGGGTGVGRNVIAMLKDDPNVSEIVTICSESSAELAKKLGADKVIDYTKSASITNDVLEYSKDKKFDYFFELAGSEQLLKNVTQFVKPRGYYINIAGGKKAKLQNESFLSVMTFAYMKLAFLQGIGLSKVNFLQPHIHHEMGYIQEAVKNLNKGVGHVEIDKVFKVDDYQEAWDYLRSVNPMAKL